LAAVLSTRRRAEAVAKRAKEIAVETKLLVSRAVERPDRGARTHGSSAGRAHATCPPSVKKLAMCKWRAGENEAADHRADAMDDVLPLLAERRREPAPDRGLDERLHPSVPAWCVHSTRETPRRRTEMDPIKLLTKQHREVEALFKKVEKSEDPDERKELMGGIKQSLELHMMLEEESFYPAVRGLETKKAEEMVLEAYEEHHVVKLVVAELPKVDPEDERFDAKMTVLKELIEHHVEEEEDEMFKLAKKLDKENLESIGDRMAAEAERRQGGGPRAA
jgi:hemerythrin superfamily protein